MRGSFSNTLSRAFGAAHLGLTRLKFTRLVRRSFLEAIC